MRNKKKSFYFFREKNSIQCRLVKELTICPNGGILYPLISDKIARNIKKIILASLYKIAIAYREDFEESNNWYE